MTPQDLSAGSFWPWVLAVLGWICTLAWVDHAHELEAEIEAFRADSVRVEIRYEPPPGFIDAFRLECRWTPETASPPNMDPSR